MKLVVGLGNKGEEYLGTRHNVGFNFLDFLSRKLSFEFSEKNKYALYADKSIRGTKTLFIKPLTYMNLSGEAVRFFAEKHKSTVGDIIIIHDDLELPVYTVKIKMGGGDGGHNGIKSITECLNNSAYARVRLGIGRPVQRGQVTDYVLGKFTDEERIGFEKKFETVETFLYNFISMGYQKAAGRFKDE
jgi:PTH1 family peptidyl-tRNA hydrolase